jgi:hypothetical protein
MTRTIVYVKTQFIGYHRWANAPDDVAFLRAYHRHVFHVKVGVEVTHGDREVEFFQFQRKVQDYISAEYEGRYFEKSCEMIAIDLLYRFQAAMVEVSEDGENGAVVYAEAKR